GGTRPGGAFGYARELVAPLAVHVTGLETRHRATLSNLLEGGLDRAPPADPSGEIRRLASAVKALFARASATTPLLVTVDDFHASTRLRVELMTGLAGAPEGRWALVLSSRENFEDPDARAVFESRVSGGAVAPFTLPPLGERDVREWISLSLPGASVPAASMREMVGSTEGNPRMIREFLQAGLEQGSFVPGEEGWRFVPPPEGEPFPPVGLHPGKRFLTLDEGERRVLSGLALHAGVLDLTGLARFAGRDEPGALFPVLRGLVRSGWAREVQSRSFALAHDRLRRPIWEALGTEARKEGHRRLAETLSDRVAEDEGAWAPVVAEHRARVGRDPESAAWCWRAAEVCASRWRWRRALVFLRFALRSAKAAGWDAERVDRITAEIGQLLQFRGFQRRAEELLSGLLSRDLPPRLRARVLFRLGRSVANQGRIALSLDHFREAARLLQGIEEEQPFLVEILTYHAHMLNEVGRYEEVLDVASRLESEFGDDARSMVDTLQARGWALACTGDLEEAFRCYHEVFRFCLQLEEAVHFSYPDIYVGIGHVRYLQGEAARALRWMDASLRGFVRMGTPHGVALAEKKRAFLLNLMGRPGEAYAAVRETLAIFRKIGADRLVLSASIPLTEMALATGRYGVFLDELARMEDLVGRLDAVSPAHANAISQLRAAGFFQIDRPSEVAGPLSVLRSAAEGADREFRASVTCLDADRHVEEGRPAKGLALITEALGGELGVPALRPGLRLAEGRALLAMGRHDEAASAFAQARDEARRFGLGGVVARILLEEARCHLASRKWDDAFAFALEADTEAARTGRIHLRWRALRLCGLGLERSGARRRAAKFFRRAAWQLEGEAASLPEPYRSPFLAGKEASEVLRRAAASGAEERAHRLGRFLLRRLGSAWGEFGSSARAWAGACARAAGADAVRFEAGWKDAESPTVVFGEPSEGDETWEVSFGEGGQRPGRMVFHRRWERGAFLPVERRLTRALVEGFAHGLERAERDSFVLVFERMERTLRERLSVSETGAESVAHSAMRTAVATVRKLYTLTRSSAGGFQGWGELVGSSRAMQRVYGKIRRWAPKDATVLVTGESGTGKELVARALHAGSERREGPFLGLNCAAVADSLLERELFGHEKGAFTGAEEALPGIFELAEGGTLVLDEVADMSERMQALLLRVLEERAFRRLGGTEKQDVDVRVIALTQIPLEQAVEAGRFRADLFHRLNLGSVVLPPLRERKEDVPALTRHFLKSFRGEGPSTRVSRRLAAFLMRYRWPGNVRELRNQIHRAAVLAPGRDLGPED
ncbi:MAG: sigma 54-interacting transcriptional regulator, partial [Planctomycetota bacterium]